MVPALKDKFLKEMIPLKQDYVDVVVGMDAQGRKNS